MNLSTQAKIGQKKKALFSRRRLAGFLLAVASVCVAFLILEMGARLLPLPYSQSYGAFFSCSDTLGWTGKPYFQGAITDRRFEQMVAFNSLGMHDTDHPLEKAPDSRRILMLGDSFVHAVQVNETETSHQVLENYLDVAHKEGQPGHFEVISSGVINWGPNQQLLYYRQQGRRFQPDLVLLMFYIGNDVLDNLPGNGLTIDGRNCYAPYFAVCEGRLDPAPLIYAPGLSRIEGNCSSIRRGLINVMGRLYQHSRLYQQLEPLIVRHQPRQLFGQAYPSAFSALYLPTSEAELAAAWQVTQATIAQLKSEVEADGARFAVVLISPEIVLRLALLSPAEREIFLRDNSDFAQAVVDLPNQRLAQFLRDQNIPFIDLTQPMTTYLAQTGAPLYIIGEGHWTAEGNRLAGELVGAWLWETGLLSR